MLFVHYLLVDGNNLAFRCYYGVKHAPLQIMPVNAVYGFLNSLLLVAKKVSYKYLIVCFDCSRSKRRTALLNDYKLNRTPAPDNFKTQLIYIKQLLPLLGGLCCEKQGVEADDLLGAWTAFAEASHSHAALISADKDLMQCVNEWICQIVPDIQGWLPLDAAGVLKKMKVRPNQIVDYLALIGDSADNYPGIAGVGPKTAARWLACHDSIDGIYENLAVINPKRFHTILAQSRELLRRNQSLAALDRSFELIQDWVPLLNSLKFDHASLEQALTKLHLNELAKKFYQQAIQQPSLQQTEFSF